MYGIIGTILLASSILASMIIMGKRSAVALVGVVLCITMASISTIFVTLGVIRSAISEDFDCEILDERDGIYKVVTSSDEIKYIGYAVVDKVNK